MAKVESYQYDPSEDLIYLPGRIFGPTARRNIRFIFDPGAFRTIIAPKITDAIGYQATAESKRIKTGSIAGKEYGYTLKVQRLMILGFKFKNMEVGVFDLPEEYEVDGLLGLDLLKKFEITLRHKDHWIQFNLLQEEN